MGDVNAFLKDMTGTAISSSNPLPVSLESVTLNAEGVIDTMTNYQYASKTATIALGEATSSAFDFGTKWTYAAIEMPASWTTSSTLTGATLSFQVSNDNVTFQNLYNDWDTEVTAYATAGRNVTLNTNLINLLPWRYIKIRNGPSTWVAGATQAATRTIVAWVK